MRALTVIAAVLALSACQKEVPRSQMPHLADFCVPKSNWNRLLMTMRAVGNRHGMEFHGGIERDADGRPLFNGYIARGYSYWFGDDLDLWIVSNPFEDGDMALNGISKKPWKQTDTQIAREIVNASSHLRCDKGLTRTPR